MNTETFYDVINQYLVEHNKTWLDVTHIIYKLDNGKINYFMTIDEFKNLASKHEYNPSYGGSKTDINDTLTIFGKGFIIEMSEYDGLQFPHYVDTELPEFMVYDNSKTKCFPPND